MPEPDRSLNHSPYDGYTHLWDDMQGPILSLAPGATAPDAITFGPSGAIRCFGFDGNATAERLDGIWQLPHSWEEGSVVEPHVHYCATTTNTGDIKWYIDYYVLDVGDVATGAPTTSTATGTASGTAWKHQITGFPSISLSGKKISTVIPYSIYRNPTTDSYANDAVPLFIDAHIRKDGEGSAQEYIK